MTTVYKAGARATRTSGLTRFESAKVEPDRSYGLPADHPAVVEGRTLFPSTVVGSNATPRLLVSGANNPKLGKHVVGGKRDGWPIYHLTLEERATCPRSCSTWDTCYGNAMHRARRHRHDAGFIERLETEIAEKAAQHPGGFLVRLHTLGDFYSPDYVRTWSRLLFKHRELHVFGYTARTIFGDDLDLDIVCVIAETIKYFGFSRFAIRTSNWKGSRGSFVVQAPNPDLLMCPAQTKKTEACATCQLCWAPSAEHKTIGFLQHGMKRAKKKETA